VPGQILEMRDATIEDCSFLLDLRNHESARKYSRNQNIIEMPVHLNWLREKLSSDNTLILIFSLDNNPCGMTRIDRINSMTLEISIVLHPAYQGIGLGKQIIELTHTHCSSIYGKSRIRAIASTSNQASNNLFLSVGYHLIEASELFNTYECKLS
jgi:RimJ/RimL family protein N-acetyltransferase